MVGDDGQVVGVDMTLGMLDRAKRAAAEMGATSVEFREGYMEALPVPDGWADVVISNGVLKPTGRLQIGDITIDKPVPEAAKQKIDLWTG